MIRGLGKLVKLFLIFGFFMFFSFSLSQPGLGKIYAQNFTEKLSQGQIEALRFKDANIKTVIRSIAQKAYRDGDKVNIVASPAIEGTVTVDLADIDWLNALEVVIRPYGYSYEWIGENTIVVDTTEKITEREKRDQARQEVERPQTEVFNLKYIDANDAKKAVEPLLSPVGRATVLEMTGQAGWKFGTDVTKRERTGEKRVAKTKVLLISDVAKRLAEIEGLLNLIDKKPKQVLIKARVMEVSEDLLDDFGFQWFTGTDPGTEIDIGSGKGTGSIKPFEQTPSVFNPATTALTPSSGLEFAFKKITGTNLEAVLKAVKDDAYTNTLSAPTIMTLDNQEASILVGEKYPIVSTEVSTETNTVTGGALDYYQDIGIQLNVVPQISGENKDFINMIIHPAVTSLGGEVTISSADADLVSYPRINTREAETQVLMKDGETIVIGGLLKDVKSKEEIGVPFLSKIPILGWFFKRQTKDTEKIDLLIFITAHVIEPGKINSIELIESRNVTDKFKKE
ncbi:MAG: hypothetical protein K9L95_04065 [Candidatus Omnitrophica bacterium]|nr:hypothetical protein [Candidatus Omnitrophota bacterium]MCF7877404.1 hypothetical protein [Candidatus Omnitrophota bacterium]MCF7878627.1 hypothetical protein [Candidatus Omnitrophota bacterium]MCF7892645.1 hypothetical protein [Candidatus Omnitrophota bacterium]